MLIRKRFAIIILSCMASSACDQSGDEGNNVEDSLSSGNSPLNEGSPLSDESGTLLPTANIDRYGTLTISGQGGSIDDIVGGFFSLSMSVPVSALTSMLNPATTNCVVSSDDVVGFDSISSGFIPSPEGAEIVAISAGPTIAISSATGSYVDLQKRPAGGFVFYDADMLPGGDAPEGLSASITGDEFPGLRGVQFPPIDPLLGVDYGGSDVVTSTSRIRWNASDALGTKVRIYTTTKGGFFLENGITIDCLAPDTGSFVFPQGTQAEMGTDFEGVLPTISRIATSVQLIDNALLLSIRESTP